MKKRLVYLVIFFAVLTAEIFIGLYVRDDFLRPYGGDILAATALCALARCILPNASPWLHGCVAVLCALVELLQYLGLTRYLGLRGTVPGIILGSTADWKDLICYLAGVLLFALAEQAALQLLKMTKGEVFRERE